MKSIFAQNMKKARNLKGWSQEGAAETIGIKRSLLGAYEEERAIPPYDKQLQIRKAYDIHDWERFFSDPNYFQEISAEELLAKYEQLEPASKKAVNALLGLS